MKKNLFAIAVLALVMLAILVEFIEGISSRNGGVVFLSFAVLWFLGTIVRVLWSKINWQRIPQQDYSFNELDSEK